MKNLSIKFVYLRKKENIEYNNNNKNNKRESIMKLYIFKKNAHTKVFHSITIVIFIFLF